MRVQKCQKIVKIIFGTFSKYFLNWQILISFKIFFENHQFSPMFKIFVLGPQFCMCGKIFMTILFFLHIFLQAKNKKKIMHL